jgi:probable rRNA maturation factor
VSIEVSNESGVDVGEVVLTELGRFVLDRLRVDPLAELSVLLVDPDAMAALHLQWMDLPGPTDVMAFPMDAADASLDHEDLTAPPGSSRRHPEAMLGDVVLCPAVAADQAASAGHSLEAELHLLCTHGILHLLGYDHGDDQEEQEMFELQSRLLAEWVAETGRGPIRTPLPGTGGEVRDAPGGRHA